MGAILAILTMNEPTGPPDGMPTGPPDQFDATGYTRHVEETVEARCITEVGHNYGRVFVPGLRHVE